MFNGTKRVTLALGINEISVPLLQQINKKCFEKCVTKPGTKLDSSEQTCLARCSDLYQESWNTVSNAYLRRAQRENVGL
ncbi:Mitochondrial import inner membrane translocase subunit Tim13 [Geranomyces variabilis]|nr:Mitochondrial import inner membrane translocase subunit Tim13 [Geranomyces variabilis]